MTEEGRRSGVEAATWSAMRRKAWARKRHAWRPIDEARGTRTKERDGRPREWRSGGERGSQLVVGGSELNAHSAAD